MHPDRIALDGIARVVQCSNDVHRREAGDLETQDVVDRCVQCVQSSETFIAEPRDKNAWPCASLGYRGGEEEDGDEEDMDDGLSR